VNDPVPPVPVPPVPVELFRPLHAATANATIIMSRNEIFLLGIIELLNPRFSEQKLLQDLSWQAASSLVLPAFAPCSDPYDRIRIYLGTRYRSTTTCNFSLPLPVNPGNTHTDQLFFSHY